MRKVMTRVSAAVLIAAVVIVLMMAFQLENVHAAFNDFSPEGAVEMPSTRVLTLPVGKVVKVSFGTTYDSTNYYYYKIRPSKTGYITFKNDFVHGYSVVLCNSTKKVVSRSESNYDDFYSAGSSYKYQTVLNYGVKKGKTYYIRVKGASGTYQEYGMPYIGNLKWSVTKVSPSKFGKKKSKAKAIKRKKTIKGLFTAGDKKARWYKFTAKKKGVKVYLKGSKNNGTIKGTVYCKSHATSGKTVSFGMYTNRTGSWYGQKLSWTRKVKCTYYVKVYPDGKTSGAYTLKWK